MKKLTPNERAILEKARKRGRGGDTMIAHIMPKEAKMLKRAGGSGTINPKTGLREFGFFSNPRKAIMAPWTSKGVGGEWGSKIKMMQEREAEAAKAQAAAQAQAQALAAAQEVRDAPIRAAKAAREAQFKSYGDLRESAQKKILEDSIKLANLGYSPYPGATLSPMSALTQRAQEIEARRSQKGIPYGKSLNILANKQAEGISPADQQHILATLAEKQGQFTRDVSGKQLRKQYGTTFAPYEERLARKSAKDINLRQAETGVDLAQISEEAKNLERSKQGATFSALTHASVNKQNRQQGLVDLQKELGTQKHKINNLNLTADQVKFEMERDEPRQRIANLQRALSGFNINEEHPDLLKHGAEQLGKAIKTYDMKIPTYGGKLMEPINPELADSYDLAERISPSYQDVNYAQRKELRKGLVNAPNPVSGFIQTGLQAKIDPRLAMINQEAKQKAKADLTALNAKYIKQGTYGSPTHLAAASDRMRELQNAAYGATSKAVKGELGAGIANVQSGGLGDITKLGQYEQLAGSEFGNILGDVKRTNLSALEKWKNSQLQNEQLYKSYQNEKGYQQPRMLGAKFDEGVGRGVVAGEEGLLKEGFTPNSILEGLRTQINQLTGQHKTEISDLRGGYDTKTKEQEKEIVKLRQDLKNKEEYERELQRQAQRRQDEIIKRVREDTIRQTQAQQVEHTRSASEQRHQEQRRAEAARIAAQRAAAASPQDRSRWFLGGL